jgi:hypothetical protein
MLTGNTARLVGETRKGFRVLRTSRGPMGGLARGLLWRGSAPWPHPYQEHIEPQQSEQ